MKWLSVCEQRVFFFFRLWNTCDSFRGASDIRYSRCRNRPKVDVGLSAGISVTVNVVDVFTKNVV